MPKKIKPKPEPVIKFCPKCGLTKISLNDENRLLGAIGSTATYTCMSCGFTTPIFPEAPYSKIKSIQKENFGGLEKKSSEVKENYSTVTKPVTTTYGFFVVKIWWKVVSLLFFILSVVLLSKYFFGGFTGETNVLMLGLINLILGVVVLIVSFRSKRPVNG